VSWSRKRQTESANNRQVFISKGLFYSTELLK